MEVTNSYHGSVYPKQTTETEAHFVALCELLLNVFSFHSTQTHVHLSTSKLQEMASI